MWIKFPRNTQEGASVNVEFLADLCPTRMKNAHGPGKGGRGQLEATSTQRTSLTAVRDPEETTKKNRVSILDAPFRRQKVSSLGYCDHFFVTWF